MARIGEHLDYYQMKTGSILYCLREIRDRLDGVDNERLASKVEEALELNERTSELEYEWTMTKDSTINAQEGAKETNNKIDQTLSSIHDIIEANAESEVEGPNKERAVEMKESLFPSGVYPITSSRYQQQHMHVEQLLDRLEGEFSTHVDALGIGHLVDSLAELQATFGNQLSLDGEDTVTFDEVESARAEGRDALHKVIFIIYGDYCDDPETRQHLLAPVEYQNEQIGRHMERRGTIPEVDPDSGEPTPETTDSTPARDADGGTSDDSAETTTPADSSDDTSEDAAETNTSDSTSRTAPPPEDSGGDEARS